MPYLTPQDLPEDDDCRPLSIPASTEWLALFGGALTELTKKYNWQDSGGLTVAETVAKMTEIIDNWYTSPCAACTTEGGYRVIRIGAGGNLEQLDENGDWVPATDEYFIPPPDAREGGTEDEQTCLAARNAVNSIHTLYESLSDSFASELSSASALVAFAEAAVLTIGFEFAPITFGIAAFLFASFELLYHALSYLTADLWTDDFSKQIECFLLACATNTDGVVTFDWDCFMDQLNSLAAEFSLSELQIRLYLQFAYILQFIGGADGLNLAGGTTEIDEPDCGCGCEVHLRPQAGWGTLEDLGDGIWRGTAELISGVYRLAIEWDPDYGGGTCWRYFDSVFTAGITYSEYSSCGVCAVPHTPLAPNGTNVCTAYVANEDPTPFTWTFRAECEG